MAEVKAFLTEAGLPEHGYAVHGGSGMSIYNRISPRSIVQLLAFAAQQPWFDAWLADQPIGGVDGSLRRRFVDTPLEGKIFAKTGTLNGANALSGVMIAKTGRELLSRSLPMIAQPAHAQPSLKWMPPWWRLLRAIEPRQRTNRPATD